MFLRLLGPVGAWRAGSELPLGSPRRIAVFSVLALHANQVVSRERLTAALWGEDPPASAVGNVYTYVSGLRRVLEPSRDRWATGHVLTSGGGTYCLHVPEDNVDALRFEALCAQAKRHRAAGDRYAELTAIGLALRLWHGEPLTGVPGPFVEAHRLRLGELRLGTAERQASLLIEVGRLDEAIIALRALVAAYPAQQYLHDKLAGAVQAAGRWAELPRPVVAQSIPVWTGSTSHQVSRKSRPVPSGRALLFGRDGEIRRLRQAVGKAAGGRGGSLRIEGSPGLGKSALISAVLHAEIPPGCRLGWAVGDELSQRRPLGVLLESFESALAAHPTSDLVKQLFAVAADAAAGPSDTTVAQAVGLVRLATQDAPLILVLDDVHWADPLTLLVWSALQAGLDDVPLLLIAASRPSPGLVHQVTADDVIFLTPLGPTAATQLVHAVADKSPDPRVLRDIVGDAGGNPAYLRHLATAGPASPTLRGVVEDHLTGFGVSVRQLLRAVAHLSVGASDEPGCTVQELSLVIDRPASELVEELSPAVGAGVLTLAEGRIAFQHRVVARVLQDDTPSALRVMLHRSFAERLAEADAPAERVLAQLIAGPVPIEGERAHWLTQHIEQLAERAPQLAVTALQRARAEFAVTSQQRLVLTAWLARLLLRLGRNGAAEAEWVAGRTTDPQLAAEMRWTAAVTYERQAQDAAVNPRVE